MQRKEYVPSARSLFLGMMEKGEIPLGMLVHSVDPAVSELLGRAGVDFVLIDGEHAAMGRSELEHHVRGARAGGTIPFYRVLENSPVLIQAALDSGAEGIIVPHVDTAEQARAAVAACRFAPEGRRGVCPTNHSGGFDFANWDGFVRSANDNIMVIPIIESRESVANIREICAVDGIDVVHFGPGDLSADMGLSFPEGLTELREAWDKVKKEAATAGKYVLSTCGIGFDDAEMLVLTMDLLALHRAVTDLISKHKAAPSVAEAAE
jgi:4-hydroxy-2-oxoheptanedioate aldolase